MSEYSNQDAAQDITRENVESTLDSNEREDDETHDPIDEQLAYIVRDAVANMEVFSATLSPALTALE